MTHRSRVTSGQNPDVMDVMDVMVTSSRKWVTSSPPESHPESHPVKNGGAPAPCQPSSHVREKSGAICKIRAKYIQRVQRALSPCRSENHIQNHIHAKFRGLKSHLITSESHPTVTSGQNSEASHIRVVTSAITSGQNPVTSRGQP